MRNLLVALFSVSALLSNSAYPQMPVFDGTTLTRRVSRSGICHPEGTIYYDRIKAGNFTPMPLAQCLGMPGSRLPKQYRAYWDAKEMERTACGNGSSDQACTQAQAATEVLSHESADDTSDYVEFAGYRFGIGLAAIQFDSPQIQDVEIVDGTVLVRKKQKVSPSVVFEAHNFFTGRGGGLADFGHGPFIAAAFADDDSKSLSKFGFGWMVGWKQPRSERSWNMGLGLLVDMDAMVLREGIEDGAPTTIKVAKDLTVRTDQTGLMLLFSSNW